MKSLLTTLSCSMFAFAVVGCGVAPKQPSDKAVQVTWQKTKDVNFNANMKNQLPANMANLVFVREQDNKNEQTSVNVAVNDRYQTSVQGGNYVTVPVCAGGVKVSTAVTLKKLNDLGFNPNVFDFAPGENYFFSVSVDENNNAKAVKVSEEVALEQLKGKKLQSHMVQRTQEKNCGQYDKREADPVPVAKEKLFGVYYFDFDVPTMSASEKQRAYNLGVKILETGSEYEVFLSGHADPMGSTVYNDRLSRKRVIDVAKTLESAGINPTKIRIGSFGEKNPILLQCQSIPTRTTRNGCNLKNRRVEALVKLDGVASTMEDVDTIR